MTSTPRETTDPGPARFARHTAYSDPGRYADLLAALPPDVETLSAAARNVIAHYRAELPELPESRRAEIDCRWLESTLRIDQSRHPLPLTAPRELTSRVAGCCRDHCLFLTAALRQHGVPARTLIGFGGYLRPPFHHDHVIVEWWNGSRWVRTDPEFPAGSLAFDVRDMPIGGDLEFQTAAQVWQGHRAGSLDVDSYGVAPDLPLRGADFVAHYVIFQVAHQYGDELLLWDNWVKDPADALVDELAALLVCADDVPAADAELFVRYQSEPGLRPGGRITQLSPYGAPPVIIDLADRAAVGPA